MERLLTALVVFDLLLQHLLHALLLLVEDHSVSLLEASCLLVLVEGEIAELHVLELVALGHHQVF